MTTWLCYPLSDKCKRNNYGFLIGVDSASGSVSERVKKLLAQAQAWCAKERGRQSRLALHLGVSRQAVSGWFGEARREHPRKQPTAEQALALEEFLKAEVDS